MNIKRQIMLNILVIILCLSEVVPVYAVTNTIVNSSEESSEKIEEATPEKELSQATNSSTNETNSSISETKESINDKIINKESQDTQLNIPKTDTNKASESDWEANWASTASNFLSVADRLNIPAGIFW